MLKQVTSLLICVVMLVATAPSRTYAQTPAQTTLTENEGSSGDAQAKSKQNLKAAFAELTAKSRAGAVTEADLKRLERERLYPQTKAKSKSGLTGKEKLLIFGIIAGFVGLGVVLAKTMKKGIVFCSIDPGDLNCVGPYE